MGQAKMGSCFSKTDGTGPSGNLRSEKSVYASRQTDEARKNEGKKEEKLTDKIEKRQYAVGRPVSSASTQTAGDQA